MPHGPAIDGLVKAFGPKPDRAEACVALARLKARTGDADAAGVLFERAVRLEPTRFPPMQAYLRHLAATGNDDATAAVLGRLAQDHRWAGEPFRRAVRGAMTDLPADAVEEAPRPPRGSTSSRSRAASAGSATATSPRA